MNTPNPAVDSLPTAGRPDLSRRALIFMLAVTTAVTAVAFASGILAPPGWQAPGIPLRQSAAIVGTLLLLVPFLFSVTKRSALAASPPAWFVAHVVSSELGIVFLVVHASGGDLLTPPGLVLLGSAFLVVQGTLARSMLSEKLATRFAAQPGSYQQAEPVRRQELAKIIERKRQLLTRLDSRASEALFSPNLYHWLRHPWRSLLYQKLAFAEARLVGSRRRAGTILALWRRVHIGVAFLCLVGLITHVVLVMFFAGYVASGDPIYWWHVAAWGK